MYSRIMSVPKGLLELRSSLPAIKFPSFFGTRFCLDQRKGVQFPCGRQGRLVWFCLARQKTNNNNTVQKLQLKSFVLKHTHQ